MHRSEEKKMIKFNNLEEMQPYFNDRTNTYEFMEDGGVLEITIPFDFYTNKNIIAGNINAVNIEARNIEALNIDAKNIKAWNINAMNINARDINAWNITAWNISTQIIDAKNINALKVLSTLTINTENIIATEINTGNISFQGVCFSYNDIICKSINEKHPNAKYFSLMGNVFVNRVLK
jgi:hypothetical protein